MADYKHGAYAKIQTVGARVADYSPSAIVYIGTAPVHRLWPGADGLPVNRPVLVNNIAEARQMLGYDDDWAKYTLCEPMHVHLDINGIGPLVLINVFNPAVHQAATAKTATVTPTDDKNLTISEASAAAVILETITIGSTTLKYGKDFTATVSASSIALYAANGGFGTTEISVGYRLATVTSASVEVAKNMITIASAQDVILNTITLTTAGSVALVPGTDFVAAYNEAQKAVIITGLTGSFTGTLTMTYRKADATQVAKEDVIGETNGYGDNTGLYALNSVYQLTGLIPAYIGAPGWAETPDIHNAMYERSQKINGHWDAYMFVDIPTVVGGNPLAPADVVSWKNTNYYNKPNETVFYPLALGLDNKYYHLSVLAAANFQMLLAEYDGIPYHTASNTDCEIIKRLYISGTTDYNFLMDSEIINQVLNKNGIASAAFVGGRWAIWGCHSADYNQTDADTLNVSETNRMMLFYVSNDFQQRRSIDVDKPMTANDLYSIVAEEQARLDALVKIGALTYGDFSVNAVQSEISDILTGDFSFTFNITTWPLARSLTAVVNWTEEGFVTYFESFFA